MNRLEKLRLSRGKSQRALAEELDVSHTSINRYERGKRKPDSDFIIRATKYFGVSSDYLLGLTDRVKN